ncbi:hypothetical protein [Rhizobium sp. 18055]|uniref:hypothetical protein n=1 Tax=Rhizobium sp. 18055 TaxID=2681403 RepID=UPI00135C1298|nr:hypothetical protein [Rhizobium sp. 18055]
MNYDIGAYKLGDLTIFWAVLPDGTKMSEVGKSGLDRILVAVDDGVAVSQVKARLTLFANWMAENTRLRMNIENSQMIRVGLDDALDDSPLLRSSPEELERSIRDGGHSPAP